MVIQDYFVKIEVMKLAILIFLIFPVIGQAGYYELGFSGNYRKLNLPSQTARKSFDATVSYTGSFAYYFAEMAAMELNYTKGQSERFVPGTDADSRTIYDFSLVGLDLILTFAERKAAFVPYIKAGMAYFAKKEVTYEFTNNLTNVTTSNRADLGEAYVPSLGFGVKFRVTQTIAFKLGLEAWTSDSLDTDPEWDWAGRAGISWFF